MVEFTGGETCAECGDEATWEDWDGTPLCSIHYFDRLEEDGEGPWCEDDWRE